MIILFVIYFIALFALYIIAPTNLDAGFIGVSLSINLLVLITFVYFNFPKYKRNLFRHSTFFILGFFIVHFQFLFQYTLDQSITTNIDLWIDETIVCKSLIISSFGFLFFIVGFQAYTLKSTNSSKVYSKIKTTIPISSKYPMVLVAVAYCVLLLFLLNADPKYLSGYYGSIDPGPLANRLQLLFGILVSSIIIINSKILIDYSQNTSFYYHIKKMGTLFNVLILIYMSLTLFIGDRGPAISIVLIYLAGYVFRVKNRPKPALIFGGIFFGAMLMSLVGLYRSTSPELSFDVRIMSIFEQDKKKENSLITDELAGSVRCLHYVVADVPNRIDHKYGWFQVRQLLASIPGMVNALDVLDPKYQDKGSPNLITYLDQGNNVTYGLGSTIVADFYVDLGLIGVILGMFVFGYFLSKFESQAFSDLPVSMVVFVFIMVFMSKSIYFSRSTALSAFQESVWIYIVIVGNSYFLNLMGTKFFHKNG